MPALINDDALRQMKYDTINYNKWSKQHLVNEYRWKSSRINLVETTHSGSGWFVAAFLMMYSKVFKSLLIYCSSDKCSPLISHVTSTPDHYFLGVSWGSDFGLSKVVCTPFGQLKILNKFSIHPATLTRIELIITFNSISELLKSFTATISLEFIIKGFSPVPHTTDQIFGFESKRNNQRPSRIECQTEESFAKICLMKKRNVSAGMGWNKY